MASVTGAIVFTDLVGFTEFTATSGDEEAVRLLALQDDIVTAAPPRRRPHREGARRRADDLLPGRRASR